MTVMNDRPILSGIGDLKSLAGSLDMLLAQLDHAITRLTGENTDPQTREAVRSAVEAFVVSGARPREATAQVAATMRAVGAAHAKAGRRPVDLQTAFSRIHARVVAELPAVVGREMVGPGVIDLRRRIKEYLRLLCLVAVEGMQKQRPRVRAVVAIHAELPADVRDDPELIRRESEYELLVPEDIDVAELGTRIGVQVVMGPPTSWADMPEALALVWRAAALMKGRDDDRLLIPCDELVGEMLISDNGVLRNLLVHKHLRQLAAMQPTRRAALSETLLQWLERGVAVDQLAREVGLHRQTLHSRVKTLRELFGESLDDPMTRLELIVALRSVVPVWCESAS